MERYTLSHIEYDLEIEHKHKPNETDSLTRQEQQAQLNQLIDNTCTTLIIKKALTLSFTFL